jgi:hypothetical protein
MEAILIPPTPSGSNDSAARAFARVGWTKLSLRLYRYATTTLGLAALGAKRAGVFEAADLVNTLFLWALSGRLAWPFEHDAEASTHLEEMLERKTRPEIADKFGCTLIHVDTVRKRIVPGIVAYARRMNGPRSRGRP